jgi:vacuolar-type H+-ATPase subunit F/Vma7
MCDTIPQFPLFVCVCGFAHTSRGRKKYLTNKKIYAIISLQKVKEITIMIKATEALAMTTAKIKAENEARMEVIRKFLEEDCDTAIRDAVDQRQFCTFVEIPTSIASHTSIINMLKEEGFEAQIRYGMTPRVLIMWK